MRGYLSTSRRTGISSGIGPAILWIPLAVFLAVVLGFVAFLRTERIDVSDKLLVVAGVGAGVLLDSIGASNSALPVIGSILIVLAVLWGVASYADH